MFLFILISCGDLRSPKEEIAKIADASQLVIDSEALFAREDEIVKNAPTKTNNDFAFALLKELGTTENLTFSPFSISLALAMLYAGAKGDTEKALKDVLHFGDNKLAFHWSFGEFANLLSHKDRSAFESSFKVSNVQWLQDGFPITQEFSDLLAKAYAAKTVNLDFAHNANTATKTINATVSKQTNGEINQLLKSDLDPNTRLLLTNALYFNAKWQDQFNADMTSEGDFSKKDQEKVKATFMKQVTSLPYAEDEQKQVILMPYSDPDFATVFVLPRDNKADVELNSESFSALIDSLANDRVDLWLPKFSHRTSPALLDALTKLGLGIIFDSDKCDLSGMSSKDKLVVSRLAHEAVVKVDEGGTTAAAATAVVIGVTSAPPVSDVQAKEFHAIRPFSYFIIHRPSKNIIFAGRVDKPLAP